jgi:hypothetical protein
VIIASELGPELLKSSHSFGTSNSYNASGKYVLVAFLGGFLKLEISGSEETRSKLKTSSFVDDRDIFLELLLLKITVSRFLGFLGQLPNKQNGPRHSIGSVNRYFMNTGWHVETWMFFNR